MTRSFILLLSALVLAPPVFLIGVGVYHLWQTDWFFVAWFPMAACIGLAFWLAWRRQRRQRREIHAEPPPLHWTDRDRVAWKHVEKKLTSTDGVGMDKLGDPQFYFDTALALAQELATIYHPDSSEPMGNVTIPELLAVGELAAHDLAKLANEYFPGGHLLTINHLRSVRSAAKWYQRASNVWWGIAAIFDPIRTGMRYLASKAGLGKPFDLLKENVILWLYAMSVQRLGHYLIELYSGRLRVGAERYRELRAEHEATSTETPVAVVQGTSTKPVTIAVLGQVKAGKSSVVNAILGNRRAAVDAIPTTTGTARYELSIPEKGSFVLLDTPGYHRAGAERDQREATFEAVRDSDLILWVIHARNPGRQPDVAMLNELRNYYHEHPQLKLPPIVVVMTHIDLLSPAMEWAPPYHWRNPTRPKEEQIRQAIDAARGQLGEGITSVVPVCAAEGKLSGIQEELLPEIASLLGEARATAMLRCLHTEADEGQVRRVFDQLFTVGKTLLQTIVKK